MNNIVFSDDFDTLSLRQQAECIWLLAGLGLYDFSNLVQWADQQILRLEQPPYPLIELALANEARHMDALAVLRQLPGDSNKAKIASIATQHCKDAFLRNKSDLESTLDRCKSICTWLNFSYILWSDVDAIDDIRLLEKQGVFEVGTARIGLIEFLNEYSTDLPWHHDETNK